MGRVRRGQPIDPAWKLALVAGLALALAPALAGCSGLGGGQIPLSGLGAISDSPAGAPNVSGSDPGGRYAFVYGNQIWIKGQNDAHPRQLTHMALATGAYLAWGPLVWSPGGAYIAFALVQDVAGSSTERSAGALFVVNTGTGVVLNTAGTASIYGHSYAWYGDKALFYANGSGISLYDLASFFPPANSDDPRPWRFVSVDSGPDTSSGTAHYTAFGDLAFAGQHLYVTRFDLTTLGGTGQVGRAQVDRYFVGTAAGDYSGGSLDGSYEGSVVDLGVAYADPHGAPTAGAWQIAANGAMVYQRVSSVDAKAGTISAKVCYDGRFDLGNCDQPLFQQASTQPTAAHTQLALSGDGSLVALSGGSLATQGTDGNGYTSYKLTGWGAPEWSGDGKTVIATQLVSATPNSAGVVRFVTNVVTCTGGKATVLVTGAQAFSWGP